MKLFLTLLLRLKCLGCKRTINRKGPQKGYSYNQCWTFMRTCSNELKLRDYWPSNNKNIWDSHPLSLSHTHAHTLTHSHIFSLSLGNFHSLTISLSRCLSHFVSLSLSLSHTHALSITHKHTHTHTHNASSPLTLILWPETLFSTSVFIHHFCVTHFSYPFTLFIFISLQSLSVVTIFFLAPSGLDMQYQWQSCFLQTGCI